MTTYTDIILKDTANNYFIPYGLIGRLGDVTITNPTQGQSLTYDATNNVWKNTSSSATVGWGGITGNLSDQTDLNTALSSKLENTATGTNSITVEGSSTSQNSAMNIGFNTSVTDYGGLALGYYAQSSGTRSIAIGVGTSGYEVKAIGTNATSIGVGSIATGNYSIAIGNSAKSTGNNSIAIGTNQQEAGTSTVAINGMARGDHCVAVNGTVSDIASYNIAIGSGSRAGFGTLGNNSAIQIGYGTNDANNTFNVGFYNDSNTHYNWQLLDGTTGLIPDARISTNIARSTDIPTVNNATLTIQKNGTDVQTFTANASSDVTANITVPTDTSDLTNNAGFITSASLPTIDQTFDKTSANAQSGVALLGLLETIYPVGSLYMSTNATCPLADMFGTWTLVSSGKALWTGNGTNGDTTIAAGLPDHYHTVTAAVYWGNANSKTAAHWCGDDGKRNANASATTTWASAVNSIYGNSSTVQPPAYVVNVWKRTA